MHVCNSEFFGRMAGPQGRNHYRRMRARVCVCSEFFHFISSFAYVCVRESVIHSRVSIVFALEYATHTHMHRKRFFQATSDANVSFPSMTLKNFKKFNAVSFCVSRFGGRCVDACAVRSVYATAKPNIPMIQTTKFTISSLGCLCQR